MTTEIDLCGRSHAGGVVACSCGVPSPQLQATSHDGNGAESYPIGASYTDKVSCIEACTCRIRAYSLQDTDSNSERCSNRDDQQMTETLQTAVGETINDLYELEDSVAGLTKTETKVWLRLAGRKLERAVMDGEADGS